MNALQPNRHTEAWAEAARSMPVPRAILAISAHWYVGATAVTSMAAPRTIHDFAGFPPELFAVEYPAPGSAWLDALRDEGVLILGSGNLVHNLGRIDWLNDEGGHAWAVEFDAWAREVLADDPSKLVAAPERSDFALAHPTPDHFIPALYIAGVAVASGGDVRIVTGGCALGSISMTSFAVA
jgi:4,5-DOPA dioxygenase extradiol